MASSLGGSIKQMSFVTCKTWLLKLDGDRVSLIFYRLKIPSGIRDKHGKRYCVKRRKH